MGKETPQQTEYNRSRLIQEFTKLSATGTAFRDALAQTDTAGTSVISQTSGLTFDFLVASEYISDRLTAAGRDIPLLPLGDQRHILGTKLKEVFSRKRDGEFPSYKAEYYDPRYRTLYVIGNSTEIIPSRNREFVPGTKSFMGLDKFRKTALDHTNKWHGQVSFDPETGDPQYRDGSFTATSATVDGIGTLLSASQITRSIEMLTKLEQGMPADNIEQHLKQFLGERADSVSRQVAEVEHAFRPVMQRDLQEVVKSIERAGLGWNPTIRKTRIHLQGMPVYYHPRTAAFATETGETVSDSQYMRLAESTAMYLSGIVERGLTVQHAMSKL
jgi:hypothetical protein